MKSVILLAVAALGLSFVQLDTKNNNVNQFQPVITSVGSTMSFEPGLVEIRGKNLDLVARVEINGAAVQVVSRDSNLIRIRPELMDPGFFPLALVLPGGSKVRETVEFTPTLQAVRYLDGMRVRINPGEHGLAWLNWSLRPLDNPFEVPGTYYPLMIDLSTPRCGTICSEISVAGEPLIVTAPFPAEGGMLQFVELRHALYLQAWCLLGDEGYQCNTNMAILAPTNVRQHKLGE